MQSSPERDLEKQATTKTAYHKKAEIDGKLFITTFENPQHDVRNLLNKSRKAQVLENRSRLLPIIKTIILDGRQNIALRGHRDDGSLFENSDDPIHNDGNFRSLLRFRIDSGDTQLEEHLKSAGSNATYIRKTTANELIKCCGEEILHIIKTRIAAAKYYSIIFDETTDMSHTSQLSLSLRYVHDRIIREDFVGFLDLHETSYSSKESLCEPIITGEIMGQTILKFMNDLGLNVVNCVGIGCDGCSVNVSLVRGAASEIRKQAIYSCLCGCKNHALNLSISKYSNVQSVKNAVGTIQEVSRFFNASAKRNFVLRRVLGHQMQGYCETRWIERHESVLEFQEDLPKMAEALQIFSHSLERSCSCSKGKLLSDILSATLILSKYLQTENIDISTAKDKITQAIEVLKAKRKKSNKFFSIIFRNAKRVMDDMDIDYRIPRLTGKQSNRTNYPRNSTDEKENIVSYWEKSVYIPILDYINTDLKDRFRDDSIECYSLNFLVPINLDQISNIQMLEAKIQPICDKYSTLMSENKDLMMMKAINEIFLLKKSINYDKFKQYNNATEAYTDCNDQSYPLMKELLKILLSLPISAASAERTFSALRRLKSWMRTRMNEDRLTGLALLYVHRDINIDIEKVINRFSGLKNRKLEFVV